MFGFLSNKQNIIIIPHNIHSEREQIQQDITNLENKPNRTPLEQQKLAVKKEN